MTSTAGFTLRSASRYPGPGQLSHAPIPDELILPLRQHLGVPAKPVVNVGDSVNGGQVLAEAQGVMSVPVHAPTSGVDRH